MTYPRCPKCGWVADIEDECPKCGVYVSKYLAVQQRRMVGGDRPRSEPPPPGVPGDGPAPAAAEPERAKLGPIAGWAAVAVVFAAVGWIVLLDWFGAAYAYTPPAGWQRVDNDTLKKAVEAAAPQLDGGTEFHALYAPGGDAAAQTMIAVVETDKLVPMTDEAVAMFRAAIDRIKGVPALGGTTGHAELTRIGGRPAIELQFAISSGPLAMSMLQVAIGAARGTFFFLYMAPTEQFTTDIDAVRASLAGFRVLRPQGLRGNAFVKYGLRWGWIAGLLLVAFVAYNRIRGRT